MRLVNTLQKGKAYWHVGQEILKKAAMTGPRASAFAQRELFPLRGLQFEKSGAMVPGFRAAIVRPSHKALRKSFAETKHGSGFQETFPN